jgi:hypothetical protein
MSATNTTPSKDLSAADSTFLAQCLQHGTSSMVVSSKLFFPSPYNSAPLYLSLSPFKHPPSNFLFPRFSIYPSNLGTSAPPDQPSPIFFSLTHTLTTLYLLPSTSRLSPSLTLPLSPSRAKHISHAPLTTNPQVHVPAIAQALNTKPHNVTCRISNLRKRYGFNITCTSSNTVPPSPAKAKTQTQTRPAAAAATSAETAAAGRGEVAKPAAKRKANGAGDGGKVAAKKKKKKMKAEPFPKASAGDSGDEDEDEDNTDE